MILVGNFWIGHFYGMQLIEIHIHKQKYAAVSIMTQALMIVKMTKSSEVFNQRGVSLTHKLQSFKVRIHLALKSPQI